MKRCSQTLHLFLQLLTDSFKEHLTNVLLYHVAVGNVSSSDLADLGITEITMANNENVTINIDETGVMVNDVMVIDPDIFLSNGMLLASFLGEIEVFSPPLLLTISISSFRNCPCSLGSASS